MGAVEQVVRPPEDMVAPFDPTGYEKCVSVMNWILSVVAPIKGRFEWERRGCRETKSVHSRGEAYVSGPNTQTHLNDYASRDWEQTVNWLIDFILSSPACRIIRVLLGIPEYLPVKELISRNVDRPSLDPMPPRFLKKVKELPTVVLAAIFKNLEAKDIYRLQMADRRFWYFIRETRPHYPIIQVGKSLIELNEPGPVKIYRDYHDRGFVSISHDQLAQSLRTVRFTILVVHHQGELRSDLFHVSELNCRVLELRLLDFVTPENENELITLLEQIIMNSRIKVVDLVVRTKTVNSAELDSQLKSIVARGRFLEPRRSSKITVVAC